MKAVIIDDEVSGAESLELLLRKHCPQVMVEGAFYSAAAGVDGIRRIRPDILFLDIEMPFANGFDVLNEVGDLGFHLIFTTAYDQYAVKAIRFSAVDYLLKPIDPEELVSAVQRAQERGQQDPLTEQIEALLENIRSRPAVKKLAIHGIDGITFVELDQVVRFAADSNYTHIHLQNGKKFTVARTLKDYEDMLEGLRFFRVHNAHLVNLNHIERYLKGEGGFVVMTDGTQIEVSRRKKNDLLALLTAG